MGNADQLAARVDRLLRLALSAILLVAGSLAVATLQPAALYSVHVALEHMVE